MIYRILISITLFMATSFVTHAQSKPNYDAFTVQVEGLGCSFCAYGLEKKFKELKGIKKIAIDLESGTFTFLFPTEKALRTEQVKQQVASAGYTAIRVQVTRANHRTPLPQTTTSPAQKATLTVAGNCGMCKARIEQAARTVDGVQSAYWDRKRQQLQLTYHPQQVNLSTVAQRIAQKGHDNQLVRASKEDYNTLHNCCLYNRMP